MRFKYFATAIAAITLAGCSNNDDVPAGNKQPDAGSAAYLKVNIGYANSSRGTSGDFSTSTTENEIKSADFYFYNTDGTFYTKSSKGTISDTDQTNASNIESIANPIVVIDKTANKFPGYMLVVLNASSIDLSRKSLTEAAEVIDKIDVSSTTNGFVMTSSTYMGNAESSDKFVPNATGMYFATPISEANFVAAETQIDNAEAVDVYVERLAAKATVKLSKTLTDNNIELEGFTADNQKISITVDAWGLNGTEKTSYLMKNINAKWQFGSETTPTWNKNWNDATNRRSYWAKSANYVYNADNYPTNYANVSTDKKDDNSKNVTGYSLDYINYNDIKTAINSSEYCRENTLSTDHLAGNLIGSATSVLIKAHIGDGQTDYFLYGKQLYTTENLINLLLTTNPEITNLQYFRKAEEGETSIVDAGSDKYIGLSAKDFEFESPGDGYVLLKFKSANKTWGTISGEGESKTFTAITDNLSAFNTVLATVNTKLSAAKIQGFKNGSMYYNIPIEHLAKFKKDSEGNEIVYNHPDYNSTTNDNIMEGQYGVVRNNLYEITINNITKLGKGVFNPDEDIIPNQEESQLWYLAAQIHILSWHIVKQETNL